MKKAVLETETKEVVERLQCQLTEAEVLMYAKRMVGVRGEREENENQLDALKKEFNARIATLEAQEGELALKVGTAKEWREVKCRIYYDFAAGEVWTERCDTYEEIKRRPMDPQERQRKLDMKAEEAAPKS